jgi:dCMP deaminase
MLLEISKIDRTFLELAHNFGECFSGCRKVAVGALIVKDNVPIAFGANRSIPVSCKKAGCMRVTLYGEDSKNHRNPEDCRSIHSEIDAICKAAMLGEDVKNCMIYVTRYPCEACARAIVAAGIRTVVYGRKQEISEETKFIFEYNGVEVLWARDFVKEDTTR